MFPLEHSDAVIDVLNSAISYSPLILSKLWNYHVKTYPVANVAQLRNTSL